MDLQFLQALKEKKVQDIRQRVGLIAFCFKRIT